MDHNSPHTDHLIANLARTQARLSWYVGHRWDYLDPEDPAELAYLYGQHTARIHRLYDAVHTLSAYSSGIVESIDQFRQAGGLESFTTETNAAPDDCTYQPLPFGHPGVILDHDKGDTDNDH